MNHYSKIRGFSWFAVPDTVLERLVDLERSFYMELWLRLHSDIQHQKQPSVLLRDDQVLSHRMWRNRTIDAKELSKGRSALKRERLLSYRKEGLAYRYFVCHPVSGITLDPLQAKAEAEKTQKAKKAQQAENSEIEALRAEIAQLKQEKQAKHAPSISSMVHNPLDDDTGYVEDSE